MAGIGDGDLERWLAELRAGDDARLRRRQRWHEQQASEGATFLGALTDLAERSDDVVVETTAGRRHTGQIRAVGIDFFAMVTRGRWTFVPIAATTMVRSVIASPSPPSGDRRGALDLTMLEALADQLPERPRVVAWLRSGERSTGELAGVGHDVVTIRLDSDPPTSTQISARAITEVSF